MVIWDHKEAWGTARNKILNAEILVLQPKPLDHSSFSVNKQEDNTLCQALSVCILNWNWCSMWCCECILVLLCFAFLSLFLFSPGRTRGLNDFELDRISLKINSWACPSWPSKTDLETLVLQIIIPIHSYTVFQAYRHPVCLNLWLHCRVWQLEKWRVASPQGEKKGESANIWELNKLKSWPGVLSFLAKHLRMGMCVC